MGDKLARRKDLLSDLDLPLSPRALRKLSFDFVAEQPTLPLPGRGDTLGRWKVLAAIAATDVCLVKILEAHYDAEAIMADLGSPPPAKGELWAVWAAEPPDAKVEASVKSGACTLSGRKAWCSGADLVTHALLTAHAEGHRVLAAVAMGAAGVSTPATTWGAVGMARVVSGALVLKQVPARVLGKAGEYLSRPGFWHGGAGIAACWFGATMAIAETLRSTARAANDPHAVANLGVIDFNLAATSALLRETARSIDEQPTEAHVRAVLRLRSAVERFATDTIERVGRSLGPGPLCQDPAHAQRCADLTTFIRQSHAERDWHELGQLAFAQVDTWKL